MEQYHLNDAISGYATLNQNTAPYTLIDLALEGCLAPLA